MPEVHAARTSVTARTLTHNRSAGTLLLAVLLSLAVTVPLLQGGGFGPGAQVWLVALSGMALLCAVAVGQEAVAVIAKSPFVAVLVGLALLSVASATWTIAQPVEAVRWGCVICSYAALAVVSGVLAGRIGVPPIAAGLATLGMMEAVLGLNAVAQHSLPDAERLGGLWRPGGSFQYPPALALLQIGIVPILVRALVGTRRRLAGAAGAGLVLAGAVVELANSRLAVGLLVVLIAGLVMRSRTWRSELADWLWAGVLMTVGAVAGSRLLEASTPGGAGMLGTVTLLAIAVAAGAIGVRVREQTVRPSLIATIGVLAVGAVAALVTAGPPGAPEHYGRRPPQGNLLHGRAEVWQAALRTLADRPLLGAGTGSFYAASAPYQTPNSQTRFAHNLPLELGTELGIVGLLLGLTLYVVAVRLAWETAPLALSWLLIPFVVAFLVSNLLDWTWHLAGLSALWAVAAGGLTSSIKDCQMAASRETRGKVR